MRLFQLFGFLWGMPHMSLFMNYHRNIKTQGISTAETSFTELNGFY